MTNSDLNLHHLNLTPARTRVHICFLQAALLDVDDASPRAWRETRTKSLIARDKPVTFATLIETPETGAVVDYDGLSGMHNVLVASPFSFATAYIVRDGFPYWLNGEIVRYRPRAQYVILGRMEPPLPSDGRPYELVPLR